MPLSKSNSKMFSKDSKSANDAEQAVSLDQFDFASKQGWDNFYRQMETTDVSSSPAMVSKSDANNYSQFSSENSPTSNNEDGIFEFEWHNSIPHHLILGEVEIGSRVLFVGNGNSNLPRELYNEHEGRTEVVCMDYSQPCIDILKSLHEKECPRMSFACGDVTNLVKTLDNQCIDAEGSFDYMVDKGLMDAMMCGEGWDSSNSRGVLQYFIEAKRALKPEGILILVSYKLSSATREYLQEAGASLGIQWTLDIEEKSNDRVSFSLGKYSQ